MKNGAVFRTLSLFAAGILCFLAVYAYSPERGAVMALPLVLVLPGLAFLLYPRPAVILPLCGLAALLFAFTEGGSAAYTVRHVLLTLLFSAVSCLAFALLSRLVRKEERNRIGSKAVYFATGAVFVCFLIAYGVLYGTFWGNLTSKKQNVAYATGRYPRETFTISKTYYSIKDRVYLTDLVFTDSDVYVASVGLFRNGEVRADGYDAYCRTKLLSAGEDALRRVLTNYCHEGEDFALRRGELLTDDVLSPDADAEAYRDKMCFDIAFYRGCETSGAFEARCREYLSYLPANFPYARLRFFGAQTDGGDFCYVLTQESGTPDDHAQPLRKADFIAYRRDRDAYEYWAPYGKPIE